MRTISYNINTSFKTVFYDMQDLFCKRYGYDTVEKLLVAGDDVTYFCDPKIALETVKFFCNMISKEVMYGEKTEENIGKYGFTVCAGIAYTDVKNPFRVSYEVAQSCCESAKQCAKKCAKDGKVGNFVDFQISRNIHSTNLENLRESDYVTASGESLLMRPYFISDKDNEVKINDKVEAYSVAYLEKQISYLNEKMQSKTSTNKVRNTYILGKKRMNILSAVIRRNVDETFSPYIEKIRDKKTAKYYDALEIMNWHTEDIYGEIQDNNKVIK